MAIKLATTVQSINLTPLIWLLSTYSCLYPLECCGQPLSLCLGLFYAVFWIMKPSDSTSTGNILGTLARSCSSIADIPNCTASRSWIATWFANAADGIDLSDADTSNYAINVVWLVASYACGTHGVSLLCTDALNSVISLSWLSTSSTSSTNNVGLLGIIISVGKIA